MLAMKNPKMDYDYFNVGTGKKLSILDVAENLIKLYAPGSSMGPTIANKFRSGDIRHCFADVSKIRSMGFEPKVAFEEGMKELAEWGRTVSARDDFDKAEGELQSKSLIKS